jgi:hypothetical protein
MMSLRRHHPAEVIYRKVTIRVSHEPDAIKRGELLTDGLLRVLVGSGARLVETLSADYENGRLELLVRGRVGQPIVTPGVVSVEIEPWTDSPRPT